MDRETLFKLIRRQEVVLWAGSGLSRYAGYPMGQGVVEKLYKVLSVAARQQLKAELEDTDPLKVPLPAFAELFINLQQGNRFALNRVLIDVFGAAPTHRHVHEQLAGIPYFEHIITTNYDALFELTHQPLNTVYHSRKLPLRKVGQPTLYKIHGHLDDPDSIVISTSDYLRFFDKVDKLLWQQLESLMVSHTLLFIGYAVEDPNVLESFLKVHAALGDNMRPAYVVGPSMSPLKVATLAKRNIHFIQATGEEFVKELLDDIKKKSLLEMKHGLIGSDATGQLLSKQGLNFVIQKDQDGADCTELRRKEGETVGRIRWSAPRSSPFVQGLNSLSKGESLHVVKMAREELTEFSFEVEGFEMPISEEVTNFYLARHPNWQKTVAIRFASGLLRTDVSLKAYGSESMASFVLVDRYSRVEISISHLARQLAMLDAKAGGRFELQFHLDYSKRRPGFDSLEAALHFVDTMIHLGRAEGFEVLENYVSIWRQPPQPQVPSLLKQGEELRELILVLQKIEQTFGMKFQHFILDGQDLTDVDRLATLLNRDEVEYTWTGCLQGPLDKTDELVQRVIEEQGEGFALMSVQEAEPETFKVLDWTFLLYFKEVVQTISPVLVEVTEGIYQISSKTQRITRQLLEVTDTGILSVPLPAKSHEPTPRELLDDVLPQA